MIIHPDLLFNVKIKKRVWPSGRPTAMKSICHRYSIHRVSPWWEMPIFFRPIIRLAKGHHSALYFYLSTHIAYYQIHAMLKIKNSIDQVLWSHHSSHSKIKIWQFINIKLKECSNYKPPESRNLNCGHNDVSPFQECGQFNRPSWRTGSNKNSYVNPFALTWTLKHYLLKNLYHAIKMNAYDQNATFFPSIT